MLIDAATTAALERIAQRAQDAKLAFTPGAAPAFGDVSTSGPASQFALDPLSVAPPDEAYLVTADERGRTCYTRDGALSLSDGMLVGANGRPMLGFTVHGGALSPLRVDPLDDALRRVQKLRVEPSGTVAYERLAVDPRTGARETERVVVGQLALARFAAGTKLHAIDANHFEPPKDVLPHVGRPGDGNFGVFATFAREASRVDIDESLRKLKDAYLAFDALAAAHKAQGRAGKTAMDLLK